MLKNEEYLHLLANPSLLRHEVETLLEKGGGDQVLQVHIDEVQKIPSLLDEVHYLIESHPRKIRFLLSGSSARKLKRGGAKSLSDSAYDSLFDDILILFNISSITFFCLNPQ